MTRNSRTMVYLVLKLFSRDSQREGPLQTHPTLVQLHHTGTLGRVDLSSKGKLIQQRMMRIYESKSRKRRREKKITYGVDWR